MGFNDQIREEVKAAVADCRKADIKIIMVTGDHPLTAASVARKIGLCTSNDPIVVEGSEVDTQSEEDLAQSVLRSGIVARATPLHKYTIVKALQEAGEVVMVTGDGSNDAPALKEADVGVVMGKFGSDVAKEAASMVARYPYKDSQ
jgi:Ca2+-transporting ATPase